MAQTVPSTLLILACEFNNHTIPFLSLTDARSEFTTLGNWSSTLANAGVEVCEDAYGGENYGAYIATNSIKNTMKHLGRIHKGRIYLSRASLDTLREWQNSQRHLGMKRQGKTKGKERRFSSLRSLLLRNKGLKRMTLQFTEMGH